MDLAFAAVGPTVFVGTTPIQLSAGGSVRVRNLSASAQYFTYGNASSVTSVTPAAGSPAINTYGMLGNSVETFNLPTGAWIVAQTATGFEMTPGSGT